MYHQDIDRLKILIKNLEVDIEEAESEISNLKREVEEVNERKQAHVEKLEHETLALRDQVGSVKFVYFVFISSFNDEFSFL